MERLVSDLVIDDAEQTGRGSVQERSVSVLEHRVRCALTHVCQQGATSGYSLDPSNCANAAPAKIKVTAAPLQARCQYMLLNSIGGDYRIVVWRRRAHLSALQGDCWRFTIAKWSALSLFSRHPDKEKKEHSETKAREQEVYVCRFCSESVRRSGGGALTWTSGGERMAIIPYRVELQLSPASVSFQI